MVKLATLVSRERIAVSQIPKDKDNCGGLAVVVEVSPAGFL